LERTVTALLHIVASLVSSRIATVTIDTVFAFDTSLAFIIPLVALLTSLPVMWREEHLWIFVVLQRVRRSSRV
jgi:hypothetical protein